MLGVGPTSDQARVDAAADMEEVEQLVQAGRQSDLRLEQQCELAAPVAVVSEMEKNLKAGLAGIGMIRESVEVSSSRLWIPGTGVGLPERF